MSTTSLSDPILTVDSALIGLLRALAEESWPEWEVTRELLADLVPGQRGLILRYWKLDMARGMWNQVSLATLLYNSKLRLLGMFPEVGEIAWEIGPEAGSWTPVPGLPFWKDKAGCKILIRSDLGFPPCLADQ